MILLNHIFKTMQARFVLWLVLFLLLFVCQAIAQHEKQFNSYNGVVSVLTETYDGALLIEENPATYDGPVQFIKYTLEGKELWRKQFDNTFWITGATSTSDSGFIMAAVVQMYPLDSAGSDTTGNIVLVKFDKCARMQWARYIPVSDYSIPTNVIEKNNDFYLVGSGINSWDQNHRKPITILKFNQNGALLSYKSFAGAYSWLYDNLNPDTMYIVQTLYIPIPGDTGIYYLFTGIQSIDSSLNTINKVVIGYSQQIFNGYGPLLINKDNIKALTQKRPNSNQAPLSMFCDLNKSLFLNDNFHYDSVPNWNFYPFGASFYHDTLLTCNQVQDSTNSRIYVSMRLYDKNYKTLKESIVNNHNSTEVPYSFLGLANNNCIVSTLYNNNETSSFYLFDSKLNPLGWPTVPPAKGYDWACKTSIPAFEEIKLNEIVQPVHVVPDTSRPNWQWLGIKPPDNTVIASSSNGWFVWPQPATTCSRLNFRLHTLSYNLNNFQNLEACFYDGEGKKVAIMNAIPEGNSQWGIPSLSLTTPGVYTAVLTNHTGTLVGSVKVVVE